MKNFQNKAVTSKKLIHVHGISFYIFFLFFKYKLRYSGKVHVEKMLIVSKIIFLKQNINNLQF